MSEGLIIGGRIVPIAGVTIRNPRTHAHCRLSSGDYRLRRKRANKVIWHTTKGYWPQTIVDAPGSPANGKSVADYWFRDEEHSAAHIVVNGDGSIDCLADIATICAFHAGLANETAAGVEVYQEAGGVIRRAALETVAKLAPVLARELEFAHQVTADPYVPGKVIERLKLGGDDCVGHFGHRDQSWKFPNQLSAEKRALYPNGYAGRGRGDPGDYVMDAVRASCAEPFRFGLGEDRATWKRRQTVLNARGANLRVDGIAGVSTTRAMRSQGYANGRSIAA